MNILFLFAQYPEDENGSHLHKDLPDEFFSKGHNVFVATIRERRLGKKTLMSKENGRHVLRIKTGNMFDEVSKVEKALVLMTLSRKVSVEIIKYWGDVKFDLIVGSTPWMANLDLFQKLKSRYKCPNFLIFWDIYPQNAEDLGLIKNSIVLKFLKLRQSKTIHFFDHIGYMSDGNFNWLIENYPSIDETKLSKFPLWGNKREIEKKDVITRRELGFHDDDFIVVFGGNMGLPQNLSNVIRLANEVKDKDEIKFLLIGKGSEIIKLKKLARELNLTNITFMEYVARNVYETLMLSCNVGIVSLHPSFTVPNFPSKTIDYVKYNLPILAALDDCALADYGDFVENKARIGLCCVASDMEAYKQNLLRLFNDKELYEDFKSNCYKVYEENFNISDNYKTIISCL